MAGARSLDPPQRIVRAVRCLDLAAARRILEIGCGVGTAAELILRTSPDVRYVAVDRSATAVRRTRERNAEYLAQGRLVVVQAELSELTVRAAGVVGHVRGDAVDRSDGFAPFDVAFAINVNEFWTRHAPDLARVLAGLLRPGGRLVLLYELPDPVRADRIRRRVLQSLDVDGLSAGCSAQGGHLVFRAEREDVPA